jgi:hypothetical protein
VVTASRHIRFPYGKEIERKKEEGGRRKVWRGALRAARLTR